MSYFGFIACLAFVVFCRLRLAKTGTRLRSAKSIFLRSQPLWILLPVIPLICVLMQRQSEIAAAFSAAIAYYCLRFGWMRIVSGLIAIILFSTASFVGIGVAFTVDMAWNWWMKRTDAWFRDANRDTPIESSARTLPL